MTIKRLFLSLAVVAIVFASCGKKELEDKLITQQKLNDSIQAVIAAKDAEMESLFQELNSIEQSLTEVTSKYGNVNKLKNNSGETVNKDTRARITQEIQSINEILANNKSRLNKLNSQVSKDANKNKELAAFIESLQTRVNEQEAQIQALTTELQEKKIVIENLNKNIDNLSKQNQAKDEQILQVESERNTAYYIIGTKKELQTEGIVSTSGGFLGIGKRTKVSGDSELAKYTKIDVRHFEQIPLNGKDKIKIMTSHPSSSYEIVMEGKIPTSIKIKNANDFWGKSRFLVVMYD
ncbi:MAG: hypothetical protein PHN41_04080 [Bacteroidales bacterium]|jgi:SMC interacting uncharacterized protein involved in chromosome segregation|nr:hypothetical protein [Bacteroidales bacterium]MDD4703658.1 hypothetical protein [Bacteroidales bacterium]MDX9798416.1 hypothetical protein [Bacteroidales bacterium]